MTESLKIGRRASALGALALAAAGSRQARANGGITPIPDERIALQLFDMLPMLMPASDLPMQMRGGPLKPLMPGLKMPEMRTSPAALTAVYQGLHEIGFRNVERFGGTLGLSLADYRTILGQKGFSAVSSHEILDDATWSHILDQAVALGQICVGAGGVGDPGLDTLEHTLITARHLNTLGKAAADRGLIFFVHNHTGEFTTQFPYDLDGTGNVRLTPAWEIVAANTNPDYVSFEIDVHWARVAFGLDRFDKVIDLLSRYEKRIRLLHMKDTAADGSITDLGGGTTDWEAVIDAAGPGILFYVWEYDNPPDPLRSARIAYDFMRGRQ